MTGPSVNHLSSARVRQLLATVGSAYTQDQAAGTVAEYDWRDPHYFNADQLNRLAAVMSQIAARVAQTFAHFHSGEFDVAPTAITQHFASAVQDLIETDHGYYLTFSPEKGRPCGFALISAETARAWVTLLLGDSDSGPDAEGALSSLEESLLCDLMTAVVDNFLVPLRPHHNLKLDTPLGKGQPGVPYELTEEICRIALRVKKAGSEEASEIAFLLPCNRLTALVGKTVPVVARVPPPELSRALMEHLQQMPVTVTARLATTNVRFQAVIELDRGDILLLGKALDQPAELLLDGRTAFRGRLARSEGRYAVFVTQSEAGRVPESPAPKTPSELKKG